MRLQEVVGVLVTVQMQKGRRKNGRHEGQQNLDGDVTAHSYPNSSVPAFSRFDGETGGVRKGQVYTQESQAAGRESLD